MPCADWPRRSGSPAASFLALALLGGGGVVSPAAEKQSVAPAQLIEQLASLDVATRREAALQLKLLGPDAKVATSALITALSDSDKQVWTNVLSAIAAIGPEAKDAIPVLLKDLHSKTTHPLRTRWRDQTIMRTAYALSRIGPVAIPALIEGLRSNDTMLRIGCARALGGMGPEAKESIPALLENIGHSDVSVQREAVEALGAIGTAAKPKLIEALDWKQPVQRSNAARALSAIGTSAHDAVAPMYARLKAETEPQVRASLLAALPRVGATPAQLVPELINGLRSDREEIRHASVNSLLLMHSAQSQIVKALTKLVADADVVISERAAYVLGRFGRAAASAVPAIIDAATRRTPPNQTHLDALVHIGDPAVKPMLGHFAKVDPATITRDHWVIGALQQMGGLAATPVAENLTHPSVTVRLLAARTLASLGADAEPTVPTLTRAAEDSDARVQGASLVALASVRASLDVLRPRIEAAFKSPAAVLRASAVECAMLLGRSGDEFQPLVIAALNDPEESVRKAVIEHLNDNFAGAVPALIPLLDDAKRRGAIIQALGRVGPDAQAAVPKLVALLDHGTTEERLHILASLGQIGVGAKEALPALELARQHPDAAVRIAAIKARVAIETQNSQRAAALILGLEDKDREVRRTIAGVIARMGSSAVDTAPKLFELTADENDREFALLALSQINVRDLPKLLELLNHRDRPVRLFALRRLENLGRRAKEAVPMLEALADSKGDPELSALAARAVRRITVK